VVLLASRSKESPSPASVSQASSHEASILEAYQDPSLPATTTVLPPAEASLLDAYSDPQEPLPSTPLSSSDWVEPLPPPPFSVEIADSSKLEAYIDSPVPPIPVCLRLFAPSTALRLACISHSVASSERRSRRSPP
jgi:hypothetical protein